jgi:hypothetical protein
MMMMTRHFSINTANTKAAVQSGDHGLHCTTCSNAPLTITHTRKYHTSVIRCHMLPGSWADHHLPLLESHKQGIKDVTRQTSQEDLGWVSEQARKMGPPAQSTMQEKQHSHILMCT